jgi:hypothetical protein
MPIYDPIPPISPPPANAPHSGSVGEAHGLQSKRIWVAGAVDERQIIDAVRALSLWRVSVFGDVLVRVDYGTGMKGGNFVALRTPLVMTIPGQAQLYAQPRDPEHTGVICKVTITPATAGARSQARKVLNAGAGPALAFDDDAVSFFALTASALTISGLAVAVPALSAVPLVQGSVLNTGSGFQEFEA